MATIKIVTTEDEQQSVLEALKTVQNVPIPVSKLSELCGLPPSRTRYALVDLEDAGLIQRIIHKGFNKHYKRYMYKVL